MFPNRIETQRIRLEPSHEKLTPKELYRHCSDEYENIDEVTRTLGWEKHKNILESMKALSNQRDDWYDSEAAHYRIEHIEDEKFIGLCSLSVNHKLQRGKLGIWLKKEYWGRKISRERALALIELGIKHLDLDSIIVEVRQDNKKSKKAVHKYIDELGGQRYGKIPDNFSHSDGRIGDSVVFGVKREDINNETDFNSVIKNLEWRS